VTWRLARVRAAEGDFRTLRVCWGLRRLKPAATPATQPVVGQTSRLPDLRGGVAGVVGPKGRRPQESRDRCQIDLAGFPSPNAFVPGGSFLGRHPGDFSDSV